MVRNSKLVVLLVCILTYICIFGSCSEIENPDPNKPSESQNYSEIINVPYHAKAVLPTQASKSASEIAQNLVPQGGEYKCKYFYLKTDLSYDFARTWGEYISQAYQTLLKIIPPLFSNPANIFIFGNRKRFQDYTQVLAPENINALGYYDPSVKSIVTFDSDDPDRLTRTLLHEITHLLLRDYIGHNCIPPWLDEGFACVFETGQFANGAWTFGLPRLGFIRYLKEVRKAREIKPFSEIMTIGWKKFIAADKTKLKYYYMLSWSIVYFMLFHNENQHKERLLKMLRELRKTQELEMRYENLYDVFIKPEQEDLKSSWNQFLNSLN